MSKPVLSILSLSKDEGVIIYSDGILPLPTIRRGEIQESICEMKPLKNIVNHAPVSGGAVQAVSNPAPFRGGSPTGPPGFASATSRPGPSASAAA